MNDRLPLSLIAVWLAMALVGCAGGQSLLTEDRVLKTRALASDEVRFSDFRAFVEDGELVLAGAVARKDGLHRTYGGHIDLAVLDPTGITVMAVSTDLSPKAIFRARQSYFKVKLPVQAPYHGQAIASFHLPERAGEGSRFDCGDNQASLRGAGILP